MSCNSVSITGNLTRDAELRRTASGVDVLGFCVAVNERRKDKDGNWADSPVFVDCHMFGKRAGAVAETFKKGVKLSVSGRLSFSQWEKDGKTRTKLSVAVQDFDWMSNAPVSARKAVS